MYLFLDTNVLLGYTFKVDSWNSQSVYVIKSKFDKYSSENVQREYQKKCQEKIKIANGDLDSILIKLSKKSSINTKKLIAVLNDHYLKPSITSLWEAGLSTIDNHSLMNKIREVKRACDLELLKNKSTLKECIVFIDREEKRYEEIYLKLCNNGLISANYSDGQIVLDAHHIGLIKNDLHFVTSDYNDIVKRTNSIVECTSIKAIIYLADFSGFCEKMIQKN